jgi:DNA-binding transcriptional MerR regulator
MEERSVYSRQQLADMFGVKPSTIQKYTTMGVLPRPTPRTGCTASYGHEAKERMEAIWGRNGTKDMTVTLADLAERWNPQPEEAAL